MFLGELHRVRPFATVAVPPMREEGADLPEERSLFCLELSPTPAQEKVALFSVLVLVATSFLESGPFAGVRPGQIRAFAPAYMAALLVNDVIIAILLFAQYSILRSRALLLIASGYVFTALMTIPWVMELSGGLAPSALIGGMQSRAWLYFSWHGGFAMFVTAYALLKDTDSNRRRPRGSARPAIALSVTLTAVAAFAVSFICVAGEELLPRASQDPLHFNSQGPYLVGGPIVVLCMIAVIMLWVRRRSMVDLWLMVIMCSYAMEIPLAYYPSPFRYSVGWYTVRVICFFSNVFVLITLLYEITNIYGRLLSAIREQRRERKARLVTGDAMAAMIAHEVKQPLSAMMMRAETSLRWLNRSTPDLVKAKGELSHLAEDGLRAAAVIERVRANFKKEAQTKTLVNLDDLIGETIALVRGDLLRHRIQVKAEPSGKRPQTKGDSIQLQEVLLNLITNAIQSMASKEGARILDVKTAVHDDDALVVSVSDTG
jgi:hypothetical protein